MLSDTAVMEQAMRLAMSGRGAVEPNPMVGCILAKDGRIIGQGRHERFGGPHAEPNALASCIEPPAGATAYVTLEPCCHLNKQTPPCVPLLIAAKISRVVIGCLDPNPSVAGEGVRQLRAAGIEVTEGVVDDRARQLNAAYFARVIHHRPYVTLKWAESADGKVAGAMGKRVTISNIASLEVIHALRSRCDAILVGIRTVLSDDPLLTARPKSGSASQRSLLRLVLDPDLRLPFDSRLARSGDDGPIIVYCRPMTLENSARGTELSNRRIEVVPLPARGGRLSLPDLLADLHRRSATHLLVEPGPGLARAFFASGLADRVWRFRSPNRIEEPSAPAAEPVPFPAVATIDLAGDLLGEHLNPASPVYFASTASADLAAVQAPDAQA